MICTGKARAPLTRLLAARGRQGKLGSGTDLSVDSAWRLDTARSYSRTAGALVARLRRELERMEGEAGAIIIAQELLDLRSRTEQVSTRRGCNVPKGGQHRGVATTVQAGRPLPIGPPLAVARRASISSRRATRRAKSRLAFSTTGRSSSGRCRSSAALPTSRRVPPRLQRPTPRGAGRRNERGGVRGQGGGVPVAAGRPRRDGN